MQKIKLRTLDELIAALEAIRDENFGVVYVETREGDGVTIEELPAKLSDDSPVFDLLLV
jgi:hypothetical protein